MKKMILLVVICAIAGYAIGWHRETAKSPKQDFAIFQSYINTGGNYKSTRLRVIVYEKDYDESEMFEKIKTFHARMNGISDELTIVLYESKEDLLNGVSIAEHTYFNE